MLPKIKQFRVVGIFEVGMFEYDSNLVLTDISAAQEFFDMKEDITGIQLRLADIYKASLVRERIQKKLGFPLYAKDWMQMNRNLFSALKLEKFAMFIILDPYNPCCIIQYCEHINHECHGEEEGDSYS